MADVMPNYFVEMQRLKTQIVAQELAIQKNILDIMEMEDRKRRHLDAINAAQAAIEKMKFDLGKMEEAHGKAGTANPQSGE